MRHRYRSAAFVAVLLALLQAGSYFSPAPEAASTGLVISQVYGAGGNSGALLNADYVEIYNRGNTPVSLEGLSLQYASATGTGNFGASSTQLTELPDVMLGPGMYFLVQQAGGANGSPLPPPDFIDPTPISMAAGSGKIALVSGVASLGCNGGSAPCSPAALARIIDLVGYGTANFFEGTGAAPALGATLAAFRAGAGTIDTDDNAADFAAAPPAPRTGRTDTEPDLPFHPIHEIQGAGDISPLAGQKLATGGIVTARKANGFFIQTPDGEVDGRAETSDAIFVFTGMPPAMVAVGDAVRVTGQVVEFRASSSAFAHTLTEIGGTVAVTVVSSGHELPTSIDAASFDMAAATRPSQLERYEGMLVHAPMLNVVGPTNRFGEFYGVLPGTPRPFREPGIDVNEPMPADASSPDSIPRFDGNLERVMVDSDDALTAAGARRQPITAATGATVAPVSGPLDYAFDEYRIVLAGEAAPEVTPGIDVTAVPAAEAAELTVAALNLENYRNVSAARREKAAQVIHDVLHTPDILGLIEVGTLSDLEGLAAEINAFAATAYVAYLEDNDGQITGFEQNIGYLVNSARIEVVGEPYQVYRGEQFTFAGVNDTLFDRPPFVLEARFQGVPLTVILNHLRSLIDVNSTAPFTVNGVPTGFTVGERVREKRRLGAEYLADLIATRDDDNLIVLGDMNALQFNDGFVDVLGTLQGSPAPAEQVVEASADRWSHTLFNLVDVLPPQEQYSYVHQGSAQVLDHVLVNQQMLGRMTRFAYTRTNADFPQVPQNDAATPRVSDHDAPVAYFRAIADLTTSTTMPAVVTSGSRFTYSMSVLNSGDPAADVTVTATLPPDATFDGTLAPDGWSCNAGAGTLTCHAASLEPGAPATFVVSMTANCGLADGASLTASVTAASASERDASNNPSAASAIASNPAPVISAASVDKPILWSPNHKMEDVRVLYTTSDNCGATATSLSVTSNEPVNGLGDGDMAPDWEVASDRQVRVRAERSGAGSGRVYTVMITATDSAGNTSREVVTITVPHSR